MLGEENQLPQTVLWPPPHRSVRGELGSYREPTRVPKWNVTDTSSPSEEETRREGSESRMTRTVTVFNHFIQITTAHGKYGGRQEVQLQNCKIYIVYKSVWNSL